MMVNNSFIFILVMQLQFTLRLQVDGTEVEVEVFHKGQSRIYEVNIAAPLCIMKAEVADGLPLDIYSRRAVRRGRAN